MCAEFQKFLAFGSRAVAPPLPLAVVRPDVAPGSLVDHSSQPSSFS